MVKESSREGNLKKKRKNAAAPEPEPNVDVYKKSIEFEEKEALNRSGETDAKIYFKTCKEIRQLLEEIGDLKMAIDDPEAKASLGEKATQVSLRLVLLKKLNRMEKVRSVYPKEELAVEKQKVDSINLQYQNLLYESNHLIAEYRKCFQFKSKDEQIELVSQDEFLLEAPDSLTSKFFKIDENDTTSKHEFRLARLEWELQQRIQLAKTCKDLEEEKKHLEADIMQRKNKLDKLAPLLVTVMEATKPVQDHLGLHIDKTQAEHKLASLLPNSLYLLYANADAYRQVNDKNMSVVITGDYDEAVQWKESQNNQESIEEDESEPEQENQEEIVDTKKRRHHRSVSTVDPMEEKKKKLLEVHPLSVEITVDIIKLKMSFCTKLKIVTVTSSVDIPADIVGMAAREVLSSDSLLVELTDGDFGLESPNPCTSYLLKKIAFTSYQSLVPKLGYVYNWAQKICGIDFLNKVRDQDQLSNTSVEQIMRLIKKRLRSRRALAQQLQELENKVVPNVPAAVHLPKTAASALTQWGSLSYQNFCQQKFTADLIENDLVTPNDIFFSAVVTRGNASLRALIIIKNDYPATRPIFALCLNYNGTHHSKNSDDIRDLERAVNVDWEARFSTATWMLSAQMMRLCACLDVYLETEDPQSFPQNTMYIKSHCGRNRRKPFKFRDIGVGIFTQ